VLSPTWNPADETKPAPMPLLLLQSFVNTWEGDSGVDLLAEGAAPLPPWLHDMGLPPGADVDLVRLRGIRESVRGLIVAQTSGVAPAADDVRVLRAAARDARLLPVVGEDGTVALHPGEVGLSSFAASLLVIVRDAQRDGTWARLKACRNPDCRWAFYDRSHAGRGAWCDMAVCGNRIKNRNLRTRRASESGATSGAPR
jgi:predicted RNA-binding Zn ribbon-like protein